MRPSDCKLYAVTVEFDENHQIRDSDNDFVAWSPVVRMTRTYNIVAGSDTCTMREVVEAYALARTKYACADGKGVSPPRIVSVVESSIDGILEIHQ